MSQLKVKSLINLFNSNDPKCNKFNKKTTAERKVHSEQDMSNIKTKKVDFAGRDGEHDVMNEEKSYPDTFIDKYNDAKKYENMKVNRNNSCKDVNVNSLIKYFNGFVKNDKNVTTNDSSISSGRRTRLKFKNADLKEDVSKKFKKSNKKEDDDYSTKAEASEEESDDEELLEETNKIEDVEWELQCDEETLEGTNKTEDVGCETQDEEETDGEETEESNKVEDGEEDEEESGTHETLKVTNKTRDRKKEIRALKPFPAVQIKDEIDKIINRGFDVLTDLKLHCINKKVYELTLHQLMQDLSNLEIIRPTKKTSEKLGRASFLIKTAIKKLDEEYNRNQRN